jgi:cation:H+ antiporter
VTWAEAPLAVSLGVFLASAVVVWIAGWRVSRYADIIRAHTGASEALIGLILLGGVTSLPEAATSITGAISGNADLVVNNILGGVAMQVMILAIADAAIGRDALSATVASPAVLLQGALDIVLLALVAAGTVVGDVLLGGVGLWSWSILIAYLLSVWFVASMKGRKPWIARETKSQRRRTNQATDRATSSEAGASFGAALWKTAALAAVILVAGYFLTKSGEGLAERTGLGSSFFGAVFLAISTSLPEVSTVLSAAKLRRYEMAISDIFGTNLFDVVLIFLIDALFRGEPVLRTVGPFATFGALLGIMVTVIFLVGLIERRDRAFLRMGPDSIAVILAYAGGLVVLYGLR